MSQIYSGTKTQIKIPRKGNHSNYNSNQRNTNNLRFNQPDSQNRNNYNQNKSHNWNQADSIILNIIPRTDGSRWVFTDSE